MFDRETACGGSGAQRGAHCHCRPWRPGLFNGIWAGKNLPRYQRRPHPRGDGGSSDPDRRARTAGLVGHQRHGEKTMIASEISPTDLASFRSFWEDLEPGMVFETAGRTITNTMPGSRRSEEHTSAPQSIMRTPYAVFC